MEAENLDKGALMELLAVKKCNISDHICTVETCNGMRIIFEEDVVDMIKQNYCITSLEVAELMKEAFQSTDPKKLLKDINTIESTIETLKCTACCEKYIKEFFPSATIVGHDTISKNHRTSINTLLEIARSESLDFRS